MRGRWIAVALVVVGVSVAVAAGLGLRHSSDPVASAALKSENAGGANVTLTVGVDSSKGSFTASAKGVVDDGQAAITADLSQLFAQGGLPAGNGSVEVRYLQENGDPVLYVNSPLLSTLIPGGKSWARVDLEQAGKAAGVDVNQMLAQAAAQNPANVLDLLRSAGSVQAVGPAAADGVTHYSATIDVAKAAGLVGGPAPDAVQHLIAQGGPSTIPVDVWVDGNGLVRKLTVDQTVGTGAEAATVHLNLGLSGYGTTAVHVTAPPSADTLDATGLISMAAQSGQVPSTGTATVGG